MKLSKLIYGLLLLVVNTSCTHRKSEEHDEHKKFVLSSTMAKMISIDTVKQAKVQSELKLSGKVSFNEDNVIKIYPLVTGTVEEIKVEPGDKVTKGQVLAVINSGEIATMEQEKISAESAVLIAKKSLDATDEMYKSGISSQKDLIMAQKEYDKAIAEEMRMKNIFRIYNISNTGQYVIKSPISGFVVEKKINNQMQTRSDNPESLFTISSLDDVWINANVYETDIDKIKEGYEADVTTLAYENKVFHGKIDKIYNVLDPETKVMKIRIRLANPNVLLKPEMFASITIRYNENKSLPEVPSNAIIFNNNKNYVMVYSGPSKIETREVSLNKTIGNLTYLSNGLKPGERVISKYNLLIYDALND